MDAADPRAPGEPLSDIAVPADAERAAARARVLAALTGVGTGDSPLRLPELRGRPAMPSPATSSAIVAAADAGDRRLARVAIPLAVLAGVDLVALLALIAAAVAGWGGALATVPRCLAILVWRAVQRGRMSR